MLNVMLTLSDHVRKKQLALQIKTGENWAYLLRNYGTLAF